MKPKKHHLHVGLIFIAGLGTGAVLKIPIENSTCLTSPQANLPIVTPLLEKEAFTIVYDARCKNPYYTVERLTKETLQGTADRAQQQFKEEEAIPYHLRATLADYKGSGFDRGHMTPAANCKKSVKVMRESFLLSNICPQQPQFNRGYWARFEGHIRDLTKQYKSVQVITGPLYLPQGEPGERFVRYKVIGPNDVAVPTHFFKLLRLEQESGSIEDQAYILPNEHIASETPLDAFQATVDNVERVSGIIFQPLSGS